MQSFSATSFNDRYPGGQLLIDDSLIHLGSALHSLVWAIVFVVGGALDIATSPLTRRAIISAQNSGLLIPSIPSHEDFYFTI